VSARIGSALLPPALLALAFVAPGTTAPAQASDTLDPAALAAAAMPTDAASSSGTVTVEAAGVTVSVSGLDGSAPVAVQVSDSAPDGAATDIESAAPTPADAQYHAAQEQYHAVVASQDMSVAGSSSQTRISVSSGAAGPHGDGSRAAAAAPTVAGSSDGGGARPLAAHGERCDTTSAQSTISISGTLSESIQQKVSAQICAKISSGSSQLSTDIGSSSVAVGDRICREGAGRPARTCSSSLPRRARARPIREPKLVTTCCVHGSAPAQSLPSAPTQGLQATARAEPPRAEPAARPKAHGPARSTRTTGRPGRLPPLPLPAPAGVAAGSAGGGGVFPPLFMALALWLLLQPPGVSVLRLPARIRSPQPPVDDRRDRPG
jgi:hypothetical protein